MLKFINILNVKQHLKNEVFPNCYFQILDHKHQKVINFKNSLPENKNKLWQFC